MRRSVQGVNIHVLTVCPRLLDIPVMAGNSHVQLITLRIRP
jgi:hypothetical protein